MSRTIPILLTIIVLAYLGICAALFIFQRSLIYFPQPRTWGSGATILTLPITDESILVSTLPREGPKALIYFGGNAEDVSLNRPGLTEAFPEHAIYLMHYRGYGGSTGKPSEEAILADALVLLDEARTRHDSITIIGCSLGSGVAVYVASLRPADRLVLVTPYDSLADIAAAHFPFFPVRLLLKDKYESWRHARAVSAPTLIITAEHDTLIPRASSEKLLSRFESGVAELAVIRGSDHNSVSMSPEYLRLLADSDR